MTTPVRLIGIAAAIALTGCVNAQWQPMPGASPTISPYQANLNCFGEVTQAGFEHPAPILMFGLAGALASANDPAAQEQAAAMKATREACMARQGYIPTEQ
jgi:hypothetical protein